MGLSYGSIFPLFDFAMEVAGLSGLSCLADCSEAAVRCVLAAFLSPLATCNCQKKYNAAAFEVWRTHAAENTKF